MGWLCNTCYETVDETEIASCGPCRGNACQTCFIKNAKAKGKAVCPRCDTELERGTVAAANHELAEKLFDLLPAEDFLTSLTPREKAEAIYAASEKILKNLGPNLFPVMLEIEKMLQDKDALIRSCTQPGCPGVVLRDSNKCVTCAAPQCHLCNGQCTGPCAEQVTIDALVAVAEGIECPKCKIRSPRGPGCHHVTCAHCEHMWSLEAEKLNDIHLMVVAMQNGNCRITDNRMKRIYTSFLKGASMGKDPLDVAMVVAGEYLLGYKTREHATREVAMFMGEIQAHQRARELCKLFEEAYMAALVPLHGNPTEWAKQTVALVGLARTWAPVSNRPFAAFLDKVEQCTTLPVQALAKKARVT